MNYEFFLPSWWGQALILGLVQASALFPVHWPWVVSSESSSEHCFTFLKSLGFYLFCRLPSLVLCLGTSNWLHLPRLLGGALISLVFSLPVAQPGISKVVNCGNSRAYLIDFHSLRNHCILLLDFHYTENFFFTYFVCFLVICVWRVKLVPIFSSWPEAEVICLFSCFWFVWFFFSVIKARCSAEHENR